MVNTVKFSQFTNQGELISGDVAVGLLFGNNARFDVPPQFIPFHTTATRPLVPTAGMIGYNTSLAQFEFYNGAIWQSLGSGGSGGGVTSVGTGAGLTGGPITTTGTISLAPIPDNNLLANTSGSSNAPVPTTLSLLIDEAIGSAQGDILYRDAANWAVLPPGTSGQLLATNGAAANPQWVTITGTGTVTQVDTNNGITGGPIITTGTIGLDSIVDLTLLANISGVSAPPIANNLSDVIDASFGSAQGNILYRDVTDWAALGPGTAGQVLTTGGVGANPSWVSGSAGTVSSVGSGTGLTGGPITTTGTLSFAPIAAHSFWANVTGGAAVPTVQPLSILLQAANNLSDVTNANASLNNISPLNTKGDLLGFSTTNARVAVGTNGQLLQANSSSATGVSWTTSAFPLTAGSVGTILRSDGTNWVATTATFANTYTANNLLYSNGANTVQGLPTLVSGVLVTDGSGVPSISTLLPSSVQLNITELGAQSQALDMNSHLINNVSTPIVGTDAANKTYVDSIAGGLTPIAAADFATVSSLTVTYNNGAAGIGATLTNAGVQATFALDGGSPSVNQRILVKNQASALQNGIYDVTDVGSGVTNWVLTRSTDYDTPAEINPGDLIFIINGTVNEGSTYYETATVTAIGTDPINFSPFFTPADFLRVANNLSDVNDASISFDNISPLTTKGDIIAYSSTNDRLPVATGDGKILQVSSGAATGLAYSTPTYPSSSGSSGKVLISDGTNNVYSTPTFPNASAAAGKFIQSNGTDWIASTPTLPSTASTAGKVLQSDGTNFVQSTPTYPSISGTAGKVLISDGTNIIYSTPTYPNTSGTAGKIIRSDGTNNVYSTATFADTYAINTILYAASANAVSGLATANNSVLVTDGSGVPSLSTTLPSAVQGNITSVGTITSGTWHATPIELAYGGTNANLTASNGGIFYSTATAGAILAGTATAGKVLQSGSSTTPSWSTPTYPSASGSAGKILRSDGTNNVYTTATFADTYTASNLLYSNGSNTVTGLATANSGVLVTSSGGVPSISSTLPAFTTSSITFSPTTGGIVGTTTNDNAASGKVGEFISSQVLVAAGVSLTNNTAADVTSISLTAGDWDVWGNTNIAATGTITNASGWTSATSATAPEGSLKTTFSNPTALGSNSGGPVPYVRYSLSGTTTIYLSSFSLFSSGTAKASGGIFARRVR